MILNWNVTKAEHDLIVRIARRARAIVHDVARQQDLMMDLTACHLNGNPLDLAGLAEADDFNLCHDVFGIVAHIDRDTGRLMKRTMVEEVVE